MQINIVNKSNNPNPTYAKLGDAGMDLQANLTPEVIEKLITDYKVSGSENSITLHPMQRVLIPTEIYIELPIGYEAQVRSRSGLSLKHGIVVLNGIGTIDQNYRGSVGLIMINLSANPFEIVHGMKLAQLVINKVETCEWVDVQVLSETDRGTGGYGHSGLM